MKKRKCKQYLKLVMLLFGVTLVLSSCQKDDDLIQIEQNKNSNQTDFKISKIDKSKLSENTTLTRKLTKLSSNLRNKKSNNSQNKTLVSNELGFTINTSYATYIESVDKTYHSYTFYIQRDVEVEMLENLLVSLEPDGTYKTSIISYNITAAEKEDISNNIYVDITNKVSSTVINDEGIISDIFNKAADCSGYVLVEWCSGTAGHDGSNNYADCTAYNSDRIYFGCGFPGGGGSTGGSTGNTSPNTGETSGGQTNNGGSGGSSSNGGVTTPTTPCRGDDCPEELDIEDLINEKNCEELNKLTSNPPAETTNPYTVDGSANDPTGLNTNIRIAITNIDDELGSNFEHGFGLYNRGNFPEYGAYAHHIPAAMDNHVHFPGQQYQFGTLHTHPNDGVTIPMFSHDDIYSLLNIKNNYGSFEMANTPNGDAVFVCVMVVAQAGQTHTYAIKIEDVNKLQSLQAIWNDKDDANGDGTYELRDFESELQKTYIKEADGINGSANAYQKTFLNFVKDKDLGVSLYEMESVPGQLETWKKLTLDPTSPNDIKTTPCN